MERPLRYALGLSSHRPIFETRDFNTWAGVCGVETDGNKAWFSNFQAALKRYPASRGFRVATRIGFVGTPGDNDKRGYGDFLRIKRRDQKLIHMERAATSHQRACQAIFSRRSNRPRLSV